MSQPATPAARRLCVVDDDPEIRALLQQYLSDNGFAVEVAEGADAFEALLETHSFDLALFDIMMPGRDGIELCRAVRSRSNLAEAWLPIIMVTAKDSDIDRILGIEVGADDYITKPFNPRELLARIKAVLRRANAPQPVARTSGGDDANEVSNRDRNGFSINGRFLDLDSCVLFDSASKVVDLTAAEFDLLHALVLSAGRAVTRGHLLSMTHGPVSEAYERSVDVLVSRVRSKLQEPGDEDILIKTVRGVGYMLTASVEKRTADA